MARMASWMAVVLVSALCGCTSLTSWTLPGGEAVAPAAAAFPPPAMIAIEYHPDGGKVKVVDVPLEPGMTIQDALEKTGAHKKFRRSFIDLQRTPKGGLPHKMAIEFKSGQISHASNYDLHPNDRIIVTEDTSTIVDDMIAKYLGGPGPKKKR